MRDQILNNIFAKNNKKSYGVVIKQLSADRFQIRDAQGRVIEADSDVVWPVGTGVKVRDSMIVGTASNTISIKKYQV